VSRAAEHQHTGLKHPSHGAFFGGICGFGRRALVAMAFVNLVVLALPYTAAAAPPANDDFDGAKVIASRAGTSADKTIAGMRRA